ncbi:MAG TPA: SMI1/KNR4 family protein [Tepidisphaeraceae bacterium]|jgi:hypothetical protein|nr:SMI1/KNR4 family protein [Tepidisphaeraceae bacterium]
MKQKLPRSYQWKAAASGLQHTLRLPRSKGRVEITFIPRKKRWCWRFELPASWWEGNTPTALARSLPAAKAVCEAIALGIGEYGPTDRAPGDSANPPLRHHRWKALIKDYLQLRPKSGQYVASVSLSDRPSPCWHWYIHDLPEEWFSKGALLPDGYAVSKETAKAICETIVRGTIESQAPAERRPLMLGSFKKIPFKHGVGWKTPDTLKSFERKMKFRFPADLIESYGRSNGGSLDGCFVFDTAVCNEMRASKFLALLDLEPEKDDYNDSILTAIQNHRALKKYALNKVPFIPIAEVDGSLAKDEADNPYNVPSLLALERETKAVVLLSGHNNRKVRLAKSWKSFAAIAEVQSAE